MLFLTLLYLLPWCTQLGCVCLPRFWLFCLLFMYLWFRFLVLLFVYICDLVFLLLLVFFCFAGTASQVKSCLHCKYSEVKHMSINKACNKQHGLGERRLKQPLNQAQPTFNDCQVSILQVKHKTQVQIETKTKQKKNKSVLSLRSTLKNILKIKFCIYHTYASIPSKQLRFYLIWKRM